MDLVKPAANILQQSIKPAFLGAVMGVITWGVSSLTNTPEHLSQKYGITEAQATRLSKDENKDYGIAMGVGMFVGTFPLRRRRREPSAP